MKQVILQYLQYMDEEDNRQIMRALYELGKRKHEKKVEKENAEERDLKTRYKVRKSDG